MRVMICGGSGFLGRALTQKLLGRGDQVIVLGRNPSQMPTSTGMQTIGWDGLSTEGWGQFVEEVDAIVLLTGANLGGGRWTPQRLRLVRNSRVLPGLAVAMAVQQAEHKPEVVIQPSGVGYYGIRDGQIRTEASPPGDDILAKICLEWEASTAPVEEIGVRRVITRTGVVLNAKEGILPQQALPFRLFIGGPLGSGKQWISWIHLQDYLNGIQFLLDHPEMRGPVNLTSPEPLTNAAYGRILAKALHRPYWIPAPAFILRLALGKMSMLVLKGQRVIPERLLKLGFQFQYPRLEDALKQIYGESPRRA